MGKIRKMNSELLEEGVKIIEKINFESIDFEKVLDFLMTVKLVEGIRKDFIDHLKALEQLGAIYFGLLNNPFKNIDIISTKLKNNYDIVKDIDIFMINELYHIEKTVKDIVNINLTYWYEGLYSFNKEVYKEFLIIAKQYNKFTKNFIDKLKQIISYKIDGKILTIHNDSFHEYHEYLIFVEKDNIIKQFIFYFPLLAIKEKGTITKNKLKEKGKLDKSDPYFPASLKLFPELYI